VVGDSVGVWVGDVGCKVPGNEGCLVEGDAVGSRVGCAEGCDVGRGVGDCVGDNVGDQVGAVSEFPWQPFLFVPRGNSKAENCFLTTPVFA